MLGLSKKIKDSDRKIILDVGTQYVKIIDMTIKKGQARLHSYRILNLVTNGRRFISKEIAKIIKKTAVDMKIQGNMVYSSVAGKSVVVRLMDMPKMEAKELKKSLKYQSELRMPFDLGEAMFDCKILEGVPAPEGKMKAIIAAAPKKDTEKLFDMIKQAGFFCSRLDVDVIALSNSFEYGASEEEKKQTYGLVNIGASRSNVTIVSGGLPVLCRELNFGGLSFTESIAAKMEKSFDDAEVLKIRGDVEVLNILEEALAPLSKGVGQSFDFFEGSFGTKVEKVFLSGGGAQIRGAVDVFKADLSRPVFLWNPLRNIDISEIEDRELLQSNAPLLAIGLGIGLGDC